MKRCRQPGFESCSNVEIYGRFGSMEGSRTVIVETADPKSSVCHVKESFRRSSSRRASFVAASLVCWLSLLYRTEAFVAVDQSRVASNPRRLSLHVVEPKERTEWATETAPVFPQQTEFGSSIDPIMNASTEEPVGNDDSDRQSTNEASEIASDDIESSDTQESAQEAGDDMQARRLHNVARADEIFGSTRSRKGQGRTPEGRATSVGARRMGSASKARTGKSSMTRLADAIRKGASVNTTPIEKEKDTSSGDSASPSASLVSEQAIHSTVEGILNAQSQSIGLLGEPAGPHLPQHYSVQKPEPGTLLVRTLASTRPWRAADRVSVRVAKQEDDLDIANLRLSVFSDFSPDMRKAFCAKSCQVLTTRRNRGATCVVATVPRYGSILSPRSDIILGSAECSFHEFQGTSLGRQRPADSILYITEVAVSPTSRRKGVGMKIMESIDKLASIRDVETIYLHVDVTNTGAIQLYERAGYTKASPEDPRYLEFTRSLNLHDGATKGRRHYLLFKDLLRPTWLLDTMTADRGTLGIEISA